LLLPRSGEKITPTVVVVAGRDGPVRFNSRVSKIVLVHGAFNELWGPHELKSRWIPALRDGLWHHGVVVDDRDVAVCFYGDLFRHDPEAEDADAFERSRVGVAEMLTKLAENAGLDALSQAAGEAVFDRTVDMVTTMTTDPDLERRVHERIDGIVTEETRVLVGHSLGSVVAYNALRRNQHWRVHTLITLGSPLGQPFVLSRLNLPDNAGPEGHWPGQVHRWVNIAAVGDKAASVSRLADVYGPRVEDVRIDNGHRAHDPEPYLNARATGAAIAAALAADG
jgi:pimeloyl-ACP methyl ester carboxylesterase